MQVAPKIQIRPKCLGRHTNLSGLDEVDGFHLKLLFLLAKSKTLVVVAVCSDEDFQETARKVKGTCLSLMTAYHELVETTKNLFFAVVAIQMKWNRGSLFCFLKKTL